MAAAVDGITEAMPTPALIPRTAPSEATRTPSTTIVHRSCPRPRPTARIIPISWVRSRTDRARVLTTPRIAMTSDSAMRAYRMFSTCCTWSDMYEANSAESITEIVM